MAEESCDLTRFKKVFETGCCDCPHREGRFIDYCGALAQVKGGRKYSHWMWWIFPILLDLGSGSELSNYYGLKNLAEAEAFLADPYLGKCLREITEALLKLEGPPERDAFDIFGGRDELKLHSCMTLFGYIDGEPDNIFAQVLDKYFKGGRHEATLAAINKRRQE